MTWRWPKIRELANADSWLIYQSCNTYTTMGNDVYDQWYICFIHDFTIPAQFSTNEHEVDDQVGPLLL